jgi:hypothetical protein
MISKSDHSSFVESEGWVSDVPFTWVISTRGSLRIRRSAYASSIGLPAQSTSLNIWPLEPFELCGIARLSMPCARKPSIHFQSPSGFWEWKREKGTAGTSSPLSKRTLRCRFPWSSVEDVYSKPMKVVKCPGSLKSSAASTMSRQAARVISSTLSRSIVPSRMPAVASPRNVEKALRRPGRLSRPMLSGAFRSWSGSASASFENAVDVSAAAFTTPRNMA